MDLLYTLAVTLLTLGILVTIHEYGHFWVARRCGVKVLRFSIGFGTPLYTWHDRSGTEFCIAAIPLGGYVKMLDEREAEADIPEEELDFAFNRKPVLSRIAIVSAGPIANFLLAIVAFYFVYVTGVSGIAPIIDKVEPGSIADRAGLVAGQEIVAVDGGETATWQALNLQLLQRIGESGEIRFSTKYQQSDIIYESEALLDEWLADKEAPDLIEELGITLYQPRIDAVLEEVVEGSAAERAGLKAGDKILQADGVAVSGWHQWVELIRAKPEQQVSLQIERQGKTLDKVITPESIISEDGSEIGQAGVRVQMPEWPEELIRRQQYSLVSAWWPALQQTGRITLFTVDSLKKMLMGLISPKNLSGPITIAKVASAYAKSGLESYVGFLALLSISLGVLNLLPIPVLDGGHILFYLIELVKGSPVSERIQMWGYQLGFSIIIGIMLLALYNDISRL